jgi:adenine phosphoribosyltransferase
LAYRLAIGLVLVRKKGKIPPKTIQESYSLEYGKNTVEMSEDAIQKEDKVLVVDDLIATGGTIAAAVRLVERLGGEIVELAFFAELPDLKGRDRLKGYSVFSLVEFEGE